MLSLSSSFIILIVLSIYIWFCDALTHIQSSGSTAIFFFTFPILLLFFIAGMLYRHDQKLMAEIRHFSDMKHQIELYSGLLEAAQYTAASIKDPSRAETYVEETFTQIRNKILSNKVENTSADKDKSTESDEIKSLDAAKLLLDALKLNQKG